MYTFCLLFSYLIKVVALFYFICCYQHVLVNKDIHNFRLAVIYLHIFKSALLSDTVGYS